MKRALSVLMIAAGSCVWSFAQAGPSEGQGDETRGQVDRVQVASVRDSESRRVAVVERRDGRHDVFELRPPSRTRLFPWTALASRFERELRLSSAGEDGNRGLLVVTTRPGQSHLREIRLGEKEVATSLPDSATNVGVRSKHPVTGYVIWRDERGVRWIDGGEEGPVMEPLRPSHGVYRLVVHGEAVALQMELRGAEAQLRRSFALRSGVSLLSHERDGVTRAVWTATDLQPLGEKVIGTLIVNDRFAPPTVSGVIASDGAGHRVPVEVQLVPIQ